MNWVAVEKTVHDMVMVATGLPGASVAWSFQNAPRDDIPMPFVRLYRENVHSYGLYDDSSIELNPTPTAGAEILLLTNVQGRFDLRIDVFSNDVVGNASAYAIAEQIRGRFSQNSNLDALDDAGLALLDRGTVQGVPVIVDSRYEGRAMLTCRIGYSDQLADPTTYIGEVDLTATIAPVQAPPSSIPVVILAP